jgi:hypothetical protein
LADEDLDRLPADVVETAATRLLHLEILLAPDDVLRSSALELWEKRQPVDFSVVRSSGDLEGEPEPDEMLEALPAPVPPERQSTTAAPPDFRAICRAERAKRAPRQQQS